MKRIGIPVLILLVALSACKKQKEYAIAINGIVNFVSGTVTFEKDGTSGVLKAGDSIVEGMKVSAVGEKSSAEIYINENAIKVLGDSAVVISKLAFSDSGQQSDFFVEKGKVFSKIKKLGKGDSFSVKTTHSVAAVRGTEFFVADDGKKTTVSCVDGKVEVSDSAARSVIIEAKEEAAASSDGLVKKQISDDQMRILKQLTDIKEIQDGIRQKYEDQKNEIKARMESERDAMKKIVTDQKAADKARVELQKKIDSENISAIKGESKKAADQLTDSAKSAMDAAKADTGAAKKAADDAKAAVKPKVDVNQFKNKQ